MDRWMDIPERRSEVPNGSWPLQIYAVNLNPQADFNPITPCCTNPNLTKHGCTDCEPQNVSWACTDGWIDIKIVTIS